MIHFLKYVIFNSKFTFQFYNGINLLKYKFGSSKLLKQVRTQMQLIRDTGKERILDRIKAIKNREHVPSDILSSILDNWSKPYKII